MEQREKAPAVCGLLNLNKPGGVTSRRVVDRVGMTLRHAKLGHAGTLDPLATGVLVVCVGGATRLIEYVQRMTKTYRTVVQLGVESDTLDADGQVREVGCPRPPTRGAVELALARQVGSIVQRPPEFSALKVQGERAYDLARSGRAVELASRVVNVHRIDLIGYEWPRLELEIVCGSGTYIRSIARDVGAELGCGGLVAVLCRTRIGPFTLAAAIDPEALSPATVAAQLHPALKAVADLPCLTLTAEQVALVIQGRELSFARVSSQPVPAGEVALVGPDGVLIAVAEHDAHAGRIRPRRVLATG